MKLTAIKIKNFRTIRDITFDINELSDGSFAYGLIGINEAGKSSLLQAIALKDSDYIVNERDFYDDSDKIEVQYLYDVEESDDFFEEIDIDLYSQNLTEEEASKVTATSNREKVDSLIFSIYYEKNNLVKNSEVTFYSDKGTAITESTGSNIETIKNYLHEIIFWKSEPKYLISESINLTQFAVNPSNVSIPLNNCLLLAGFEESNYKTIFQKLISDPTERDHLTETLGEVVTKHINAIWPNHKVNVVFNYNNDTLSFIIKEKGKSSRGKSVSERSDGFRQFISFLLTVSAQSKKEKLSNTILLLDEPETHLHPQAQKYLLDELISISSEENKNNCVFFATHSNYFIDKSHLDRNYKIEKDKNITSKTEFDNKNATYASVNYDVFDIISDGYHNEIYDLLREQYSDSISKDNISILEFDNGYLKQVKKLDQNSPFKGKPNKVTLPTYIRNAIHYPQNKESNFDKDLEKSISILIEYLDS